MRFFPHRPRIEIVSIASSLLTGEETEVKVRLRCKTAVKISKLTMWVHGVEQIRFTTMDSVRRKHVGGKKTAVTVLEAQEMPRGDTEFTARVAIPASYTPSYDGQRCTSRYTLHFRLELPFWPGRSISIPILIEPKLPLVPYPGQAFLFFSGDGEPVAKRSYLEGSIVSDVLAPGEVLRGAVALMNTEFNRYRDISVSLVGTEHLHYGRRREEINVRRLDMLIKTASPSEGESFDMSMQIPGNIAATTSAALWTLSWTLEIVAHVRLGKDVMGKVPVTVVPRRFVSTDLARKRAPRVGSDRLRILWESVATELGMEGDDRGLYSQQEGTQIRITREHRKRLGWVLNAEFTFASLGLGVKVSGGAKARVLSWRKAKNWESSYTVSGREEHQVHALLGALQEVMMQFSELTLVDNHAQCQRVDSGMNRKGLVAFVKSALAFAAGLQRARRAVPPPKGFAARQESWRQYAKSIHGTLEPGNMKIVGRYRDQAVEIQHQWSKQGEHESTQIVLSGLGHLRQSERYCVQPASGQGIDEADLAELSETQRDAIGSMLVGCKSFDNDTEQICLLLSPASSPEDVKVKIQWLAAFAQARGNAKGPYR